MGHVTRRGALCVAVKAAYKIAVETYKFILHKEVKEGDEFSHVYNIRVRSDKDTKWYECRIR